MCLCISLCAALQSVYRRILTYLSARAVTAGAPSVTPSLESTRNHYAGAAAMQQSPAPSGGTPVASPMTRYHLSMARYHLPMARYHLRVTRYHVPMTRYHLPMARYHLPMARYHLAMTCYHLPWHAIISPMTGSLVSYVHVYIVYIFNVIHTRARAHTHTHTHTHTCMNMHVCIYLSLTCIPHVRARYGPHTRSGGPDHA